MIHSTSRPSYRFDSRDQPHNLQGPEKKENAKPFVKNSLKNYLVTEEHQTKHEALPTGGPV